MKLVKLRTKLSRRLLEFPNGISAKLDFPDRLGPMITLIASVLRAEVNLEDSSR